MPNKRIATLRAGMNKHFFDAAILLYSRDTLYYAGVSVPCILLITPETARLYVRRAFEFAVQDATIEDLTPNGSFDAVCEQIRAERLERSRIGLELDVIPVELFQRVHAALPHANFESISPLVLSQRMVKDEEELSFVRRSAWMADQGHLRAPDAIREGVSEIEMAADIEAELRRSKHEGILINRRFDAYTMYGMIGSGENLTRYAGFANIASGIGLSRAMRVSASDRVMRRGDLVMVDITGCCNGYITDITRPYVIGTASKEQKEVFDALRRVEECILGAVRPDVPVAEIYRKGVEAAERTRYGKYFMGYGEKGLFVGHGLGLELDEPPIIGPTDPTVLQENMTLAVEINTIIPGFGAIKLEDSFIVEKNGPHLLSEIEHRLFEVDI